MISVSLTNELPLSSLVWVWQLGRVSEWEWVEELDFSKAEERVWKTIHVSIEDSFSLKDWYKVNVCKMWLVTADRL